MGGLMAINDLLREPVTAYLKLDEKMYKAEQELVERYKSFVAEILRLSLAGIAVFGFLYNQTFQSLQPQFVAAAKSSVALGVFLFGVSAVCALIFLYFAAEGLRYYIVGLRHYARTSEPTPVDIASAQKSLDTRDRKVRVCRWSKIVASLALGCGGVCMAVAAILLLQFKR